MDPKHIKKLRKNEVAKKELIRAHSMLALLSLSFAFFMAISLYELPKLNIALTVTALALLALVAVISAGIVWRLKR